MHQLILRKANALLQSRHLDTAPSEGWSECPHEPLGSSKFPIWNLETGNWELTVRLAGVSPHLFEHPHTLPLRLHPHVA